MTDPHIPVLATEVLTYLDPQAGDCVMDGTLGFGGHAKLILDKIGPTGTYIGFDQDHAAISFCKDKFKAQSNLHYIYKNYDDFYRFLKSKKYPKLNGALLDLGMSSFQLDHPKRGFSYLSDAPLDMRMDTRQSLTAEEVLKSYDEKALSDIFYNYGELKHNKNLVQNIKAARRTGGTKTTFQLIELIKSSYRFSGKRSFYIKTCAQVFQALRIEVNHELKSLEIFLKSILPFCEPGAKIAIISFHSLEDRLVKRFIQDNGHLVEQCHKKVIQASQEEIILNSRAKPAKLRVYKVR